MARTTTRTKQASPRGAALPSLPGAVAAPMPRHVEPELSTLVAAAPSGPGWLHEIKWDGYRILSQVDHGKVALYTRRGNDWTDRLPELANALRNAPIEAAIFDGELVSLNQRGASDFQRLQDALGRSPAHGPRPLVYYAFDLLYLDGFDLRPVGLARRKALLADVAARIPPASSCTVRLSEHVLGQGPAFFAEASRLGLEGIVCKQTDAPYRSGRSDRWLKVKCLRRQEFVIVGRTDPQGSRSHFGALLLATYAGASLVYRGRVGTGFSEAALRTLHQQLAGLRDSEPHFVDPPSRAEIRDVHWVKPTLVAEVSFGGFTRDGLIRHATFLGLREDKRASDVALETPP